MAATSRLASRTILKSHRAGLPKNARKRRKQRKSQCTTNFIASVSPFVRPGLRTSNIEQLTVVISRTTLVLAQPMCTSLQKKERSEKKSISIEYIDFCWSSWPPDTGFPWIRNGTFTGAFQLNTVQSHHLIDTDQCLNFNFYRANELTRP